METLRESFGRRLRTLRESRGHSREFLAQNAKIDPTSVYRVETAKQWIAPETLQAISEFYKVSPAIFFTDEIVKIEPTPLEAAHLLVKTLEVLNAPIITKITGFLGNQDKMTAIQGFIDALDGEPPIKSAHDEEDVGESTP